MTLKKNPKPAPGNRWWLYTDTGIDCLACDGQESYAGISPFALFNRMEHDPDCPVATLPGGVDR